MSMKCDTRIKEGCMNELILYLNESDLKDKMTMKNLKKIES